MERLGDDAGRLLAAAGAPQVGPLADIVRAWPGVVGEAIARNAWPQRLARDGTLHVATASATWAFELTQLAPDVLDRLCAAVAEVAPTSLRFAPGRVPAAGPQSGSPESVDVEQPTADDRCRAAEIATTITDSELRSLVVRAAAASLARARSGRGV